MKIGIHNLEENGLYLRVQLREIYIYITSLRRFME